MNHNTLPQSLHATVQTDRNASTGANCISHYWLFGLFVCAVLAGCATPDTVIVSNPPGAAVSVNGVNVGTTPMNYRFDFGRAPNAVVKLSKVGYLDGQVFINKKSPEVNQNQLNVVMEEDEAYKTTTTSDAANNWLRVQVDPSVAPDVVWQKFVDSVTSCYPSLEMIDATSGYMRSVYSIRKFKGSDGHYQVRTRFICSISSKTPLVYKMKIEAEKSAGHQNWVPYDRIFKQDAQLIDEIQNRLSVK